MFSRVRWRCLESEDPREIIFDKKKNSSHIGGTQMQSVPVKLQVFAEQIAQRIGTPKHHRPAYREIVNLNASL